MTPKNKNKKYATNIENFNVLHDYVIGKQLCAGARHVEPPLGECGSELHDAPLG
jgi:hypothetical protein